MYVSKLASLEVFGGAQKGGVLFVNTSIWIYESLYTSKLTYREGGIERERERKIYIYICVCFVYLLRCAKTSRTFGMDLGRQTREFTRTGVPFMYRNKL